MSKAISFVAILWMVFFLNVITPFDFNELGLAPRSVFGLLGIVTMPFLHANIWHLISNSIPLIVLLSFLHWTYKEKHVDEVVLTIIGLAGALLWLFGRATVSVVTPDGQLLTDTANHVGASGLVYGLFAYCFFSSIKHEKHDLLFVTLFLFVTNYGSILSGMLPGHGPLVSWDGHLTGAVAGACVAFTEDKLSN
tara:strand:+ start:10 stop:591 length:582 start_codon:yes stop_codon:yes gene_type:complete